MTPAEVCRKAAQVIRERGWNQGGFVRGTDAERCREGAVCVIGAMNVAEFGSPCHLKTNCFNDFDRPSVAEFRGWLTEEGGARYLDSDCDTWMVVAWNDAPCRTADEVIAALEATASRLEKSR